MALTARRLTALLAVAAAVLGLAQDWALRHHINTDGISYLDLADQYAAMDWSAALNGYWSPLYPFLLGLTFRILRPEPYWEFAAAHALNGVIFLAALLAFHSFLRQFISWVRETAGRRGRAGQPLPEWALIVIGYLLFLWSTVRLIGVGTVTPDLTVAAIVFAVAAVTLSIRRGYGSVFAFAVLGFLLGAAYLAKAIMFPLAFVFLTVAAAAAGRRRTRSMIALATFAVVSLPLIVALSISKGRMTFGDSGKLNYAWYVNGVPFEHWQGEIPGSGSPAHPTRRIWVEPAAYEFGSPLTATYPPWFDPSYWNEGVLTPVGFPRQMRVLGQSARIYLRVLFRDLAVLVAASSILLWVGRSAGRTIAMHWMLLIPAAGAFVIYAPVHAEPRFLGAFVVLFWMAVIGGIQLPGGDPAPLARAMLSVIVLVLGTWLVVSTGRTVVAAQRAEVREHQLRYRIVEGLRRMGVVPGDRVACLGRACDYYWARLAHVRIVASVPPPLVRPRAELFSRLAATGAKVVMATDEDAMPDVAWQRIAGTDRRISWLRP